MDEEIVSEFLVESRELLDRVDRELVALEREPHSQALISSIFRSIHTMKGTAVCLGYSRFAWIAHNGESVLGRLRDGVLTIDPNVAGAMLEMVDVLRQILGSIESAQNEGANDHGRLVARLEEFARGEDKDGEPTESFSQTITPALAQPLGSVSDLPRPERTIRLDVRLLDEATRLGGAIAEAMREVERHVPARRTAPLADALARLERLGGELEASLRRTRMQPIGNLWLGFPRIVRDLAIGCGKTVRLETDGAHVELDRTLLESIKDPLSHLVRNAVDHGIEDPALRARCGKEATGLITLGARRSGRQVIVYVADDGQGVDFERVRQRALERRLITPALASHLGEPDLLQLLFAPGFSTTDKVTHVSGRGVGLDVVKSNVEAAGGRVEIASTHGLGTTVRLRFTDASRPLASDARPR